MKAETPPHSVELEHTARCRCNLDMFTAVACPANQSFLAKQRCVRRPSKRVVPSVTQSKRVVLSVTQRLAPL